MPLQSRESPHLLCGIFVSTFCCPRGTTYQRGIGDCATARGEGLGDARATVAVRIIADVVEDGLNPAAAEAHEPVPHDTAVVAVGTAGDLEAVVFVGLRRQLFHLLECHAD